MKDADALAIAVFQHPAVAAARRDLADRYAQDPSARWPLNRARIAPAVAEYAFAAAQSAVGDPARPVFQWRNAAARNHAGLAVPAGRFGTDNPDNVYLWAAVSADYSYRIEGRLAAVPACVSTFTLLDNDYTRTSQIRTLGLLNRADLVCDGDGRFVITIDADEARGRANHLQAAPGAQMLSLRETLADWSRELPASLAIVRTDLRPTPPVPSLAVLAERAAACMRDGAPDWALKFHHDSYERLPPNQPQPIQSSAKRLGGLLTQFSSHGAFTLDEDEAYVVRVDPFDADYVGFQVADAWMVSADYVDRPGSLNNRQAVLDADGRITFVIARRDPGVPNWIDPGDIDMGGTTIRYLGIKDPARDFSGAFESWHGKLAQLDGILPAATPRVDAAARAAQFARRAASYRRRERALLGLD